MMKMNSVLSRLGLLLLLCAVLQSCSVSKPIIENNTEAYQLVFEDQFDGTAYNTKLWTSLPQREGGSPWNRYVMEDAALAEVKDGNLHIRARWNEETDLPETGAIQTKDKFSFKYGKIEVRAKFNSAEQGGWPAIWLMPQNDVYAGWPNGGEIDIMERLNNDNFVHQVVHQSDGNAKHISKGKTPSITLTEYNTYGIVKRPNRIEFYVNNKLTMVHEPTGDFEKRWPFETDYYIILNHASADKGQSGIDFWPGLVTSTENFPLEMAIDYVKVWEFKD
ncbi:glycoside hydrolase family 16 protein [Gelidibacter salicanalis]|uniref:Glycoside hydrolase family 16 protein n=1 Tax=Gelidibacter salicanalis TaxID=291193 RepID=A0A5C7AMG3_9FLAO|nr:glycoside hydrolase family 16 protein [Gelidibacter salicanalis]TXE09134.1 glycoside hydrolase family 16 protein [Gelidibacter salicanalis]